MMMALRIEPAPLPTRTLLLLSDVVGSSRAPGMRSPPCHAMRVFELLQAMRSTAWARVARISSSSRDERSRTQLAAARCRAEQGRLSKGSPPRAPDERDFARLYPEQRPPARHVEARRAGPHAGRQLGAPRPRLFTR